MNESNRQKATTQPQRPVVGSVPVLFSVRNVQPRIVSAITQPNPSLGPVSNVVPTSPASEATTPALATSVSHPIKTGVPSINNRAYNTAIGLLVIALCLLVIRNTQGSKPDSKEAIASNSAIPVMAIPVMAIPVEIKSQSNLKVELVPPPLPNATSLKPFDLESASAPNPGPTPSLSLVLSSSEVADAAHPGPPSAQSSPPLLLQSKVPPQVSSQGLGFVEPVRSNVGIETVPTGLSFPESRVAMIPNATEPWERLQITPASPQNSSTNTYRPEGSGVAPASTSVGGLPGIVDTNSPSLTTRDLLAMQTQALIELRRQGLNQATSNGFNGQPYQRQDSEPGVPAMNVSNAAPVSNMPPPVPDTAIPKVYKPLYSVGQDTKDPSILAGRPYSTLPQEFPSLPVPNSVPNYEREAILNRQSSPAGTQNSLAIRQPATNEANRYPTTTQTPYAPLPPQVQNGSSFGYPPGK